jgi:Protein of unknown function (DUF2690)
MKQPCTAVTASVRIEMSAAGHISRKDITTMNLRKTTLRPGRRTLAALVLSGATLAALVVPGIAQAANAGNPQTSGCAASEVTLLSTKMYNPRNGTYMGAEYLRYSNNCQTEWTTVDYANGYSAQPSVWMQNRTGTNLYTVENNGSAVWTYQLANMKYATACGGAQMYNPSGAWVAWEYIGCA